MFEANTVDVLFTDLDMSGEAQSGTELAVALRSKPPSLPVLYTSGGWGDRRHACAVCAGVRASTNALHRQWHSIEPGN